MKERRSATGDRSVGPAPLVKGRTRIPLAAAGFVYALFAAGCFRLAIEHDYERGVSVGEGLFVLLGAAGLFIAASLPRWRAAAVAFGTLPLVGWFVATPWNSGPPFLVASLVAPCIAGAALARSSFVHMNPS
jgi:hypothetical protein